MDQSLEASSRCSACIVQTSKAKQGLGYVESVDIREVTRIRKSYDQTQWKGLKSDIAVNVVVFNGRFFMQFPKVALNYDVDLSR